MILTLFLVLGEDIQALTFSLLISWIYIEQLEAYSSTVLLLKEEHKMQITVAPGL